MRIDPELGGPKLMRKCLEKVVLANLQPIFLFLNLCLKVADQVVRGQILASLDDVCWHCGRLIRRQIVMNWEMEFSDDKEGA